MDDLMLKDAKIVHSIQQHFHLSTIEGLAASCSKLGDPKYTYNIIFPIIFWWAGPRPGGMVLLTAAIGEWTNIALKWLFRGDRPYWWVGEHASIWKSSSKLIQVPITCETGPGMPSGHVMILLAVLLSCCRYVPGGSGTRSEGYTRLEWRLAWWLSISFAVVIGVTRLLISTHFVHQVILGVVVGTLLDIIISKSYLVHHLFLWTTPTSSTPLLLLFMFLLTSCLSLYWLLLFLKLDPAFSVPLAQKYCQDPSWVHLDTTPFYSLCRSTGTILGMSLVARFGMSLFHRRHWETSGGHLGGLMISIAVIGCLGYMDFEFSIYGNRTLGFYIQSLIKSGLVPWITIAPLWLL